MAAGCYVEKGKLHVAADNLRVVRRGEVIGEGKVSFLRRFKENVSFVEEGLECGVVLDIDFEFEAGDILEEYTIELERE